MRDTDSPLRFGPFALDPATLRLTRDGVPVHLAPQPAKLLALLVSRRGEMVSRDEIRAHVWGSVSVEFESGLHTCIRQIRQALDDDPNDPRYIETIPRRGYRFLIVPSTDAEREEAPTTPRIRRASVAIAVCAVVATAVGGFWLSRSDPPRRATLVVLPFASLLAEDEPSFLADGLAEEIRTDLAQLDVDRLGVIARVSSERYRDGAFSVQQIVDELAATHLLEGSLRRAPEGLVLSARLVRTDDQTQIWSERFAVEPVDGADPVVEISRRVTAALAPTITHRERAVARVDRSVRDLFLEARYLYQRGERDAAEARLRRAVDLEPDYAEAHALLADLLQWSARADEAARHAKRAIEVEPHSALANRVLGHVALARLKGVEAGTWYEKAVQSAPADPESRVAYGNWLLTVGRVDEAIAEFHRALENDPVSPLVRGDLPWSYFFARRFDEASEQAARSLELIPGFMASIACRFWVSVARGDEENAKERLRELLEGQAASPEELAELEALDAPAALSWYWKRELRARRAHESPSHSLLARYHGLLGEKTIALNELALALEREEPGLIYVSVDPRLDSLRGDERFDALVERVRDVFMERSQPLS